MEKWGVQKIPDKDYAGQEEYRYLRQLFGRNESVGVIVSISFSGILYACL